MACIQLCFSFPCPSIYSLAQTCFMELSRSLSVRSKLAYPFTSQHSATADNTPPQPSRPKASRDSYRPVNDKDKVSKEEREWTRERTREAYVSWCAAKAAQQCMRSLQGMQALTGDLRNPTATATLSEKAMRSLPDFALLDLAPHRPASGNGVEPVPLGQLVPSAQAPQQFSLNWFAVLTYTYKLLQRCFWSSRAPTSTSSSDWSLHYHSHTPKVFYQARALVSFLSAHCSDLWFAAAFPAFPLTLLTAFPNGGRSSSAAPPTTIELPYLQAGDQELTIVWCSPYPLRDSNFFALFAFNLKGIKTLPPPNLAAAAIEVHTVLMSHALFKELRTIWKELMDDTKVFLENTTVSRPTSRSPSKQRLKLERSLLPPVLLQACVHTCIFCSPLLFEFVILCLHVLATPTMLIVHLFTLIPPSIS